MKAVWINRDHEGHDAMGDFVSLRVYGRPGAFRDYTAMGVADEDSGSIVAVMLFHDFNRDAGVIQISGAADTPRWLTRPILKEMFDFPFEEVGCQALVMRVDAQDKRLDRILTAYGFEKHVLPRMRGRGKDEAIYLLFDDVWRSNKFNRQRLH